METHIFPQPRNTTFLHEFVLETTLTKEHTHTWTYTEMQTDSFRPVMLLARPSEINKIIAWKQNSSILLEMWLYVQMCRYISKSVSRTIAHERADSWCTMARHDARWPDMMHDGQTWCTMARHDALWPDMMHYGQTWCTMARHDARWSVSPKQKCIQWSCEYLYL